MEMITDTIYKTFGLSNHMVAHYRPDEFIVGIELEIEACKHNDPLANIEVSNWTTIKDGSLRNDGRELISLPIPKAKALSDYQTIHKQIKLGANPFTERTSIHVHVNCQSLTQRQVKNLVLWYSLYEPIFFSLVAEHRKNNIHCVPLSETVVSNNYSRAIPVMVNKWSKYTALNLLPLCDKGTVEFRHMDGHNDFKRFEQWLTILENLWHLARDVDFNRKVLERPRMVEDFFLVIFRDTEAASLAPYLDNLTANTLVDVKFAVI